MEEVKTICQQIELLKLQELIITDENEARHFLNQVNYYRFSGYFKLFTSNDKFSGKITFGMLKGIYEFDSELRNLLNYVLEYLEILFKTQIASCLATNVGPLSYKDRDIYDNVTKYNKLMDDIDNCIKKKYKNEDFIKNYSGKDIPVWVIAEILSFGSMSKLYSNLKVKYKKQIANLYLHTKHLYLKNHMYVLTCIRNNCAHRSRIYGKDFVLAPKISKKDKKNLNLYRINTIGSVHKIFIFIFIMLKYLDKSQKRSFINKLEKLIDRYKECIILKDLGFVENWKDILLGM
ncbi:MAG: Abi family protein [Bacilli bacterium]|nr:Abi family protein [Bacilli bacterium]